MTSPIPITKEGGGLFGRHSRRSRPDESLVSLPQAGSVRSSMTTFSDNHFEVGSLDLFSARPRMRTSIHSANLAPPALRSPAASRADSKFERDASPRRVLRESKTIDNLADRYDASTIRELMDRDQKRRERKRRAQGDRARRRLESYIEGVETGGPSARKGRPRSRPRTPRREKAKREAEEGGLGLTGVEAGPSRVQKRSTEQPQEREQDPVKDTQDLSRRNPFDDPESQVVTPLEEPMIDTAKETRYSHTDMSTPSSPSRLVRPISNLSQATDPRYSSPATTASTAAEPASKPSGTPARKGGSFAALFRRGSRQPSDRIPEQTSGISFANTSREAMSRQPIPAHLRQEAPAPRARSGTPTRTMSKFREDLPEYPVSPPDSRMQSLEIPEQPTGLGLTARQREKLPEGTVAIGHRTRALSRGESPSVGVLSQSLASVDSEGSWLSGKPNKRASAQMTPGALESRPEAATGSYENLGATDEEYFRRHVTNKRPMGASGIHAAITGRTSPATSGQKEGVERRGNVGRTPTLVHHQQRAKSSEGLLKLMTEGENESIVTTPVDEEERYESAEEEGDDDDSTTEDEGSPKMVSLGHARSVSRGSATLLSIPAARGSRGSYASTQGPTPPLS